MLDGSAVPLTVVSKKRLGFGVSLSSNVAQRFPKGILAVFRRRFDAEEAALFDGALNPLSRVCVPYNSCDSLPLNTATGWAGVCRWTNACRHLSLAIGRNQLRRYSVHMYSGDPVFSVVGQEALLRAFRVWHDATSSFGLRMAIARKRQVGPCLALLESNIYLPMGIITAAPD
jgi:hypothetical protein